MCKMLKGVKYRFPLVCNPDLNRNSTKIFQDL